MKGGHIGTLEVTIIRMLIVPSLVGWYSVASPVTHPMLRIVFSQPRRSRQMDTNRITWPRYQEQHSRATGADFYQ